MPAHRPSDLPRYLSIAALQAIDRSATRSAPTPAALMIADLCCRGQSGTIRNRCIEQARRMSNHRHRPQSARDARSNRCASSNHLRSLPFTRIPAEARQCRTEQRLRRYPRRVLVRCARGGDVQKRQMIDCQRKQRASALRPLRAELPPADRSTEASLRCPACASANVSLSTDDLLSRRQARKRIDESLQRRGVVSDAIKTESVGICQHGYVRATIECCAVDWLIQ